jgi:hypothetical protein
MNGEASRFMDAVAAYVQIEDGFMTFKNASHEVVLMVNTNHVLAVSRSFAPVEEPRLVSGGGVPRAEREPGFRFRVFDPRSEVQE